ncbi:MAG: hypothetical protein K0R94_1249 [Burkholderiales bacterium]|jgi:hypothetical protein|nr:hypothetical protein [Burkholderiales bacterium]
MHKLVWQFILMSLLALLSSFSNALIVEHQQGVDNIPVNTNTLFSSSSRRIDDLMNGNFMITFEGNEKNTVFITIANSNGKPLVSYNPGIQGNVIEVKENGQTVVSNDKSIKNAIKIMIFQKDAVVTYNVEAKYIADYQYNMNWSLAATAEETICKKNQECVVQTYSCPSAAMVKVGYTGKEKIGALIWNAFSNFASNPPALKFSSATLDIIPNPIYAPKQITCMYISAKKDMPGSVKLTINGTGQKSGSSYWSECGYGTASCCGSIYSHATSPEQCLFQISEFQK